jgi:hypothetical protein
MIVSADLGLWLRVAFYGWSVARLDEALGLEQEDDGCERSDE